MKRIIDLMRIDLMGFKGKKDTDFKFFLFFTIVLGIALIFAGSFVSLFVLVVAIVMCNMLLSNEEKKGYRKSFGVVPTDRKSVVIARFALLTLITTITGIITFIIMSITNKSGLYDTVWTDGAYADTNKFLEAALMPFINKAASRIVFGMIFMISLMVMSSMLRKYYKKGYKPKKNAALKGVLKVVGGYFGFGFLVAIIVFTPLKKIVFPVNAMFFSVIKSLAVPFDGMLAMLLFIAAGYGFAVYMAVCAVVDYEKREL
ncbi:ABC-2 transporter permease [uncultured Ruminococcus sp.]|uniref:ABC-2 transporter permease n=1 Tax=uncultured Ruminococcus sp. TaxID=165186 RepID=UPI0025D4A212|nr:ABC-2 transporter permease [uncultured Ruminococcus sp.]